MEVAYCLVIELMKMYLVIPYLVQQHSPLKRFELVFNFSLPLYLDFLMHVEILVLSWVELARIFYLDRCGLWQKLI